MSKLVVVVGDHRIPYLASHVPTTLKELLNTDKISMVICTGNSMKDYTIKDSLSQIASTQMLSISRFHDTTHKIISIDGYKIALINSSIYADTRESPPMDKVHPYHLQLMGKLDADILIHGSNHLEVRISEDGVSERCSITPGSITGSSLLQPDSVASFILLDINEKGVSIYAYRDVDGEVEVDMFQFQNRTRNTCFQDPM